MSQLESNEQIIEFAKMKLSAKVAKFSFDLKYFLQTIDYRNEGKIPL